MRKLLTPSVGLEGFQTSMPWANGSTLAITSVCGFPVDRFVVDPANSPCESSGDVPEHQGHTFVFVDVKAQLLPSLTVLSV